MLNLDHALAHWFRERLDSTFADILWFMSAPGSAPAITIVLIACAVVFIATRRWRGLAALMLTVPIGAVAAEGLKLVFQRARPFEGGPFGEWGGYSFPSGHTTAATLMYLFLASALVPLFTRRRWRYAVLAAAAAVIAAVGLSRIALGAHYLTDVLMALTIGSTWFAVCHWRVRAWRAARLEPASELTAEPLAAQPVPSELTA